MNNSIIKYGTNIDSKNIYELLENKPINATVTYNEIKSICIKKDDRNFKSSLSKAIKTLRNNGIIYHNIRLIGYKRANSSDIVKKSPSFVASAKKRLINGIKELDTVNELELTNEEKIKKNTYLSVNGLMLHLAKPKQIKNIEQKVMNNSLSFNPADNLQYLANS